MNSKFHVNFLMLKSRTCEYIINIVAHDYRFLTLKLLRKSIQNSDRIMKRVKEKEEKKLPKNEIIFYYLFSMTGT